MDINVSTFCLFIVDIFIVSSYFLSAPNIFILLQHRETIKLSLLRTKYHASCWFSDKNVCMYFYRIVRYLSGTNYARTNVRCVILKRGIHSYTHFVLKLSVYVGLKTLLAITLYVIFLLDLRIIFFANSNTHTHTHIRCLLLVRKNHRVDIRRVGKHSALGRGKKSHSGDFHRTGIGKLLLRPKCFDSERTLAIPN